MTSVITDPLRQKLLLGAAALGVVLDGIDGSIVNVALPALAESFSTDTGTIAWVIITYLLMMGGLLLVFGKLADRGLSKNIFLAGIAVFAIGSAACGFAPSLEILLASRLVQGTGAAMIAAVAPLLCIRYLPKDMTGVAFGTLAASASTGFAAGPALGGIILQNFSWNWIFLINIPIGIVCFIFAARVIPSDAPAAPCDRFDYAGAAAFFGSMVFATLALEKIPSHGALDPTVLALGAAGLVCAGLFLARELAVREPFLDVRIFASIRFSAALGAFLLVNVIFMGILYLLPFYLTTVMEFDNIAIGLCLLVPPAVIAAISIPFGRWSDRAGRRIFILVACFITVIYSAIFAGISPGAGIAPLLAGLILMGASFGIVSAPASGRIIETAPKGLESTASSLPMTVIYFGGVLGTAIYAAIFTFATMDAGTVVDFAWLSAPALQSGFHVTAASGLLLSILAVVLAAVGGDPETAGNEE